MRLDATGMTVSAGARRIVNDASLHIAPGEMVGLIGPNGAGKSTLLRAILNLVRRDAGHVTFDGKPESDLSARERARAVSYLPQDRQVEWRLPARDIVMLGRYPHRSGFGGPTPRDVAAVEAALDTVEAAHLADQPVATLSGGERSRVLLARALAVEAPLLLADEPTAALDPYHQLHVMDVLRQLTRRGVGVVTVIHDLALAMRFTDRLVLMDAGKIVADGAPSDVLSAERLSHVYRIRAAMTDHEGERFATPWSRTGPIK